VRCPYCGLAVQLARTAPIYQPAPEPPLSWKWLWFGIPLIAAIAYLLVTGSGPKQVRNGPNGKLALVHRFGDEGVGAGEFTDLRGFAAGNGLIFTQERKGRVQAFDLTGRQAGSWILPGEFSHFGFVASTDGSVYKPYDRILRRFEGNRESRSASSTRAPTISPTGDSSRPARPAHCSPPTIEPQFKSTPPPSKS